MRIFSLLSLSALLLTCFGCSGGGKVPEELRNLCPASVTVTNGTQPMAGVMVTLLAKGSQGAYACNGVTDNNGVALIQSSRGSHTAKGVPAGTYSVILSESITLPADLESQESDQDLPPQAAAAKEAKRAEFLKTHRVIPESLTLTVSSPLELAVADKSGATLAVDVAQHKH